jgi:putative ABC transport system ATP-binding protein
MQTSPFHTPGAARQLRMPAAPGRIPEGAWPGALTPSPPVLRLRDVGVGETRLSLSAYAGDIVHLGGGSPIARLRVLAMAAGFGPCGSGHCEILGHDLREMAEAQRRSLREGQVARVLACDHLSLAGSALEAVALPLVRLGCPDHDAWARAELELDALGASHLAAARPDTLPLPDARLVLLARALVMRPRLLVLEQPETDLSAPAVSALRLALWALSSAFGTCVLLSTDHPRLLASADRYVDLDRHGSTGPSPSAWV